MKTLIRMVLLSVLLLPPDILEAACSQSNSDYVCTANSTVSEINSAISSAASGYTVYVGNGSSLWSSTVDLKNGVTLSGAGKTSTLITGGSVTMATNSRLSGFGFTNTTVFVGNSDGWRVDNNKFTYSSLTRAVLIQGDRVNQHPTGVVDHNDFYNGEILTYGDLGKSQGMWALSDGMGTGTNVVYIENNNFDASTGSGVFVDGNMGARFVFRFNTCTHGGTEHHGIQGGNRGVSLWEYYNNIFNAGDGYWVGNLIRSGGSGVIFNNTYSGYSGDIYIENQTSHRYDEYSCDTRGCDGNNPRDGNRPGMSGYPCRDQIGRGRDTTTWDPGQPFTQVLSPVYSWNNKRGSNEIALALFSDSCGCGDCIPNRQSIHIVENRDYYNGKASFNGTVGVGWGPLANRPATCTTNSNESGGGVAYWATDQGSWNQSGSGGQGVLYRCSATNTWTIYYTPYTYPHPLTKAGGGSVDRLKPNPPVILQIN